LTEGGAAAWQAGVACVAPAGMGGAVLDMAGALALAAAAGADPAEVAALLPPLREGVLMGVAKTQEESE
jgi:hypothetical protein